MKTRLFRLIVPYLLLIVGLYKSFGLLDENWNLRSVKYLCVVDSIPSVEAVVLLLFSAYLLHLESWRGCRAADRGSSRGPHLPYRLGLLLLTLGTMTLVLGLEALIVVTFLRPTREPVSYVFGCMTPDYVLPFSALLLFCGFHIGWVQGVAGAFKLREFFWVVDRMRSIAFLLLGLVWARCAFLVSVHNRYGHFLAGPQLRSDDSWYLGVVFLVASFVFLYNSVDIFAERKTNCP